MYFKAKFSFNVFRINKKIKFKEKGYNAFVDGMIALSNKDYKKAILESNKASNYLSENPSLSLLLKSEVLKIEKKYDHLHLVYQEMINRKSTENLGLKGMMEYYLHSQDYHHAFIYGEKLFNQNPYIEKIYDTLLSIIIKTNNWQQLLIITDKAFQKKIINKKVFKENKFIFFFEIEKIKKYNDPSESIKLISNALKLNKNFPPFVELYIDLLIEDKKYKTAKTILKNSWSVFPYNNYKFIIKKLAECSNENYLDLVKDITSSSNQKDESRILIVDAFISSKQWNLARDEIKNLLDFKPKKDVCLMMAKIEEGEFNDIQKMNAWKMRSNNGSLSNIWVCTITNRSQDEWSSVSDGGYFNSLEWTQPNMLKQIDNINKLTI